jgi:hypothetical protein
MCYHNHRTDESLCYKCCAKQMNEIDYDKLSVVDGQIVVVTDDRLKNVNNLCK